MVFGLLDFENLGALNGNKNLGIISRNSGPNSSVLSDKFLKSLFPVLSSNS